MTEYESTKQATQDVRAKVAESEIVNHPLGSPTLATVVPDWTKALSGFEAHATVTPREELLLSQIRELFEQRHEWLERTAQRLAIGTLNEHGPARVLFMGLFRDLQLRFASKQNLNPHKLAVLFVERYTVYEEG